MAKIIGLKEKQHALAEIGRKIKSLVPINEFLQAKNPDGVYTITFDKFKAPLLCTDEDAIKALVFAYKKELVAEIREQAQKFTIEFDEDEEALLK